MVNSDRVDGDDVAVIHARGGNLAGLKMDAIDRAQQLWGQGSVVRIEQIEYLASRSMSGGFGADITVRLLSEPRMEIAIPELEAETGDWL